MRIFQTNVYNMSTQIIRAGGKPDGEQNDPSHERTRALLHRSPALGRALALQAAVEHNVALSTYGGAPAGGKR